MILMNLSRNKKNFNIIEPLFIWSLIIQMFISFFFLLPWSFCKSFCFYSQDTQLLCPEGSKLISISEFSIFSKKLLEQETTLELYITTDIDINTQFDFNSLKLQNTDVKITGIQKNRIIYLNPNNLMSNHKSLSLNDITVYVDKVNNLSFTNLSLFKNSAFITKETGNHVSITSKELHGDINSVISLSNIISSPTSISCSEENFKEGQIQIKGDSEIFLKLYNFDSKSGYSIKLIENQFVIENQGQQFIIAFDDSSVKILIENSQGSTIVLNSIVERLIPHQTTTIEIQSSFNSITRFSECNWPVRHNSIIFNGLGSSILELDNSNLPLRVNSAIGNLTIRLISKYASITSIQLPNNSKDQILIESNSSEKVVLNISKLYTYSNPLMANGNLIVSISSLFPRS